MRGASNFRQIPDSNIYALGQPTAEAIDEVVRHIKSEHPDAQQVIWITLREEPIVYINGAPYCLRREMFSLRNIKGVVLFVCSALVLRDTRLWRYICFKIGST
jgi:hypothetical protein